MLTRVQWHYGLHVLGAFSISIVHWEWGGKILKNTWEVENGYSIAKLYLFIPYLASEFWWGSYWANHWHIDEFQNRKWFLKTLHSAPSKATACKSIIKLWSPRGHHWYNTTHQMIHCLDSGFFTNVLISFFYSHIESQSPEFNWREYKIVFE